MVNRHEHSPLYFIEITSIVKGCVEILKRTGLIEIKSIPGNFDYKNLESSAFAWLAMKRDHGKLIPKAYLTGAKNSRKLGVIYR